MGYRGPARAAGPEVPALVDNDAAAEAHAEIAQQASVAAVVNVEVRDDVGRQAPTWVEPNAVGG